MLLWECTTIVYKIVYHPFLVILHVTIQYTCHKVKEGEYFFFPGTLLHIILTWPHLTSKLRPTPESTISSRRNNTEYVLAFQRHLCLLPAMPRLTPA
jgi:hypothetical protein